MITIQSIIKDEEIIQSFDGHNEIKIGKSPSCDFVLKGWLMAHHHATIKRLPAGYVIEDVDRGANGTVVNGKSVDIYGPLKEGDVIEIGKYLFNIIKIELDDNKDNQNNENVSDKINAHIDDIVHHQNNIHSASYQHLQVSQTPSNATKTQPDEAYRADELKLMKELHQKLIAQMDLKRTDVSKMSDDELHQETLACLNHIIESDLMIDKNKVERIKMLVLHEAVGLGPLESLLSDKSISEIMVNSSKEIYVEQHGKIQKSPLIFSSDQAVLDVIERIVSPIGRRIDESSPMVDARLKDGSRVNAIIPPLAIKGPTITIRKFPEKRLGVAELVEFGSLSESMADFLQICVKHKKNVIISGGTGSGKTTLLNVLSNFIPNGERVITIEDAAELKLNHDHLISLESRPSNAEGKGLVSIRDLVKNSLRMRPDRIVVGECRGAEALDMLQAMNTGHEGSLTTLHANTPRDALSRLETMILMAGMDLPLTAIREQIVSAIDIIVQQTRFNCGSRKITYITEVSGIEGGTIQLQDLFIYKKTGYDNDARIKGYFMAQDAIPSFYQDLADSGINLRTDYFSNQ